MLTADKPARLTSIRKSQVTGLPPEEVEYPEADGQPMAETDTHLEQMVDALMHPLKERYRNDADVYISGNLFVYYEEGNPKAVVAPDVFVVFGVPKKLRRIYKIWEEGRPPDIVFELTSRKTYREDLSDKRILYEELGVREYFLFDPLRDYLRPPLQGFRHQDGYYRPLLPDNLPDGEWQLESEVLGLTLQTATSASSVQAGSFLRLYDPQTERYLLSRAEEAEARRQAEAKLAEAIEKQRILEDELARLRTELDK
jgi:Uma2 family endonuclease